MLLGKDAAETDAAADCSGKEREGHHRSRESCNDEMLDTADTDGSREEFRTRLAACPEPMDDAGCFRSAPPKNSAREKRDGVDPANEDRRPGTTTHPLSEDTILVRFRPAVENCPRAATRSSPRNGSPQQPAKLPPSESPRLVTSIVTAEMEPNENGPALRCSCPPVPEYSGLILPSRLKGGAGQSANPAARREQEAFPSREFFDPETEEEEETTRAFHMAKKIFEEECSHIFPHDVEVSACVCVREP